MSNFLHINHSSSSSILTPAFENVNVVRFKITSNGARSVRTGDSIIFISGWQWITPGKCQFDKYQISVEVESPGVSYVLKVKIVSHYFPRTLLKDR